MGIKIRKAPGPDGVPNWILHDFAPNLGEPLASIVNSSTCESFVTEIWKCADVIPLPKTSPVMVIEKYFRPISLTPTVCKACVEHCVCEWLWQCIMNKIDPLQYSRVFNCRSDRPTTV